ncbi:16S rRNA (adenine(1518)-N(6)/adenine(1519)-N(6))-dimethyltransferase RsmA [Silvibacterium bohemicum]|uniref:16S rRNA (adenine(1518)-N(6)/adenine(1519)-N(6))- dimethyltransferase RsmA n=1 Tax=Silvibacterium bohemicum TaxID=1577686 RepID=UPI0009E55B17|nr:16S rRNA (adenine(1518)-N(6)/adenine(1519)-N(6))-dimethyltransferase RsmA [Silvibacterium bohemicum]
MKHKPKLGQNFLVDPAACMAIAQALGDLSQHTVVEIGPGAGAITEILAPRARRLIAIELDRDLAPRLREQFSAQPSVEILQADVLTVDFDSLRESTNDPLMVIGNLPYYITSDILLRLFRFHAAIARAVLMVQREVADRIAAVPGTRDYGLLSATAQLYARVERVLTLPPTAFMPPPEVHSTVLRLEMHPRFEELGVEAEPFFAFLKQSFAQKRKTLAKNLRAAGFEAGRITQAIASAGVSPMARAEELGLESMAQIWQQLRR